MPESLKQFMAGSGFTTLERFMSEGAQEGDQADLRIPLEEAASALGSGLVGVGESIGGTMEMLGIPLGRDAREYWQKVGEHKSLQRPEYLQEGTILDHPERLSDWRWWTRSLGENAPNMAAMMLPGLAAMKGAKLAGWGMKAIKTAGLIGGFGGAAVAEGGSAYSQA